MISALAFSLIESGTHPWLFVKREDLVPCWTCADRAQRDIVYRHLFAPIVDTSDARCRYGNPACINPDHLYLSSNLLTQEVER